jgi:hypothetical protein
MKFRILLINNKAPRLPDSLQFNHANAEAVFLPSKTTYFVRPLHHGVIRAFKSHYTRRSLTHISTAMDNGPDLEVMQCWKD